MYRIRAVKYSEHSVSIQVYVIENRKRKIIKHIGTARTEEEKDNLILLAQDFIQKIYKQLPLFEEPTNQILNLYQLQYNGVYYLFFYELLHKLLISRSLNDI